MLNLDNKISLENFLKSDFSLKDVDADYINEWNNRSFFSQMLDSFGEMNYTLQIFQKSDASKAELKSHLNRFHEVCCMIYNNPNVYDEEKETLKLAEWEFINYILWNSNDKSCIYWFNQWNNDINFELL